jgi:hypothetical protein
MWIGQEEDQPPRKYYVNGKTVQVLAERVEYLDDNGKLVTDSLRDYSQEGTSPALYQPQRIPPTVEHS